MTQQTDRLAKILKEAGVAVTPSQMEEMIATYTKNWELDELYILPRDLLEMAVQFPYNSLAPNPRALRKLKKHNKELMERMQMRSKFIARNGLGYYVYQSDIDEAFARKELTEVAGHGLRVVDKPVQLSQGAAIAFSDLALKLKETGLGHIFWVASTVRSEAQIRWMERVGFPVLPQEWGHPPNVYGDGLNLTIADTRGSGGYYDQWLSQIDEAVMKEIRKMVKRGHLLTIDLMIQHKAITNKDFLRAWEILKKSGFKLIDLTPIYSMRKPWWAFGGWRANKIVNPVFLLAY